jgi:hypothetical protein
MFALAQSFVGFEAAVSFNDFAANYERQVTVEQLLAGERLDALAAFSLNDNCALIEKLDASGLLSEELSEEQVLNLAKYFVTLPSEAAMKLWQVVARMPQPSVKMFHGADLGSGDSVASYLAKILGA